MNKIILPLLLLSIIISGLGNAQEVFQPSNGGVDVVNNFDNTNFQIGLTTQEQKANIRIYFPFSEFEGSIDTRDKIYLGLSGSLKNSYSGILSGGNLNPGISLNTGLVLYKPFGGDKSIYDFLFLNLSYNISQYKLINTSESFQNQISKTTFKGYEANVNYNMFIYGAVLSSVTAGYGKFSNAGDLDLVSVKNYSSFSEGTNLREVSSQQDVLLGSIKEFNGYPFSLGLTYVPSEEKNPNLKPGLNVLARTKFSNEVSPVWNIALNIFLTEQNEKTLRRNFKYGFLIELKDVFSSKGEEADIAKRITFGISTKLFF